MKESERSSLLGRMSIKRYAHTQLLPRIWQLRHNMWPYDAAYVALAESLGAELVTLDGKIEKVPGIQLRRPQPQGIGRKKNLSHPERTGVTPVGPGTRARLGDDQSGGWGFSATRAPQAPLASVRTHRHRAGFAKSRTSSRSSTTRTAPSRRRVTQCA